MIKIGCSGFPVGKKKYVEKLHVVELTSLFNKTPRPSTVEKWKNTAPEGFEYIACSPLGLEAFQQSHRTAKTLRSKIVLLKTPNQFAPHADNVQKLQTFVKRQTKSTTHLVWEHPKSWPESLITRISEMLNITPVENPLSKPLLKKAPLRYFRMGSDKKTKAVYRFSDTELKKLRHACDKPLNYVIFNNGPTAFYDAVRFASLQ